LSRADRKKRKGEREVITTNLPENRKAVRQAIKEGRIGDVKEEDIDVLEISDRLDMMGHRSDILTRSAQRLLDQVIIMAEDADLGQNSGDGDQEYNDALPTKLKPEMAVYGKTGEMFGLRGVAEPTMDEDQKITDLDMEAPENQAVILPVPKMNPGIVELDEPKNAVGDDDVVNMYKNLGFEEEHKLAVEKREQHREEESEKMKEAAKK
jgi:hypothetical protein